MSAAVYTALGSLECPTGLGLVLSLSTNWYTHLITHWSIMIEIRSYVVMALSYMKGKYPMKEGSNILQDYTGLSAGVTEFRR